MKLKIFFENSQNKERITYKLKMLVRSAIFNTLSFEGLFHDAEISVTFVDNEQIRDLNCHFRNTDSATDVLSFPQYEPSEGFQPSADGKVHLGDIVLSLECARQQSLDFGHSFEREVAFLCVHSTLHLLGYDHLTEKDDDEMRKRQRKIMKIMGMTINNNKTQKPSEINSENV
ncbi:MAG: rRNA maturation RNase YbeY [Clostridiales bacterium]|nr:rRNA maturation RNase YbeY [Clostridiales bacterium]